jgi:flagellar biosynthesis/type III secretory pathway protein FliH
MFKNISAAIAISSLISLSPAAHAQQPQITPAENAKLSQEFRAGFLKGCNNGQTPGVKNQRSYCNCLANAYQTRYSGVALNAITQLANASGSNGARLTNLMMAPEANSCSINNR